MLLMNDLKAIMSYCSICDFVKDGLALARSAIQLKGTTGTKAASAEWIGKVHLAGESQVYGLAQAMAGSNAMTDIDGIARLRVWFNPGQSGGIMEQLGAYSANLRRVNQGVFADHFTN